MVSASNMLYSRSSMSEARPGRPRRSRVSVSHPHATRVYLFRRAHEAVWQPRVMRKGCRGGRLRTCRPPGCAHPISLVTTTSSWSCSARRARLRRFMPCARLSLWTAQTILLNIWVKIDCYTSTVSSRPARPPGRAVDRPSDQAVRCHLRQRRR